MFGVVRLGTPERPKLELTVFHNAFTVESIWQAMDVLAKMGIGALLGGFIGLERERSGRPAGIRTHMLLVLGVVLICEVSKAFGAPDNSRIAAQIVTGVGFLGAGTIMRTGVEVKGLTTAASLWAASAIGFAVSLGGAFIIVAAAATMLTLFTLAVVDNLESRIAPQGHLRELLVSAKDKDSVSNLIERLEGGGFLVEGVRILSEIPECTAHVGVFGGKAQLLKECMKTSGISGAEFR
jgi:putative Mg2+ transporter-C (MgtC) family protein